MRSIPLNQSASLVALLLALAGSVARADPAQNGRWGPLRTDWPNVAIHASVLPDGRVLFWGRREWSVPGFNPTDDATLDTHECTPRIWDPSKTGAAAFSTTPKLDYNLFCSGHTFLADGRLFVACGHIHDTEGVKAASIYDYRTNKWTRVTPEMPTDGRWYPTAITLPDGKVLIAGGTRNGASIVTEMLVFDPGNAQQPWSVHGSHDRMPYYPRMAVASNGKVFMSGSLELTQFWDESGNWKWLVPGNFGASSRLAQLQYNPAILFDQDKLLYIGGGFNAIERVDFADLKQRSGWVGAAPLRHRRVQHNGTLLPDGSILVTGGTQGPGFNDLTPGGPIHAAELWDPNTQQWTEMAEEAEDRCYHSTAVLLPDATVLSAGGGEYRPDPNQHVVNPRKDSKLNAQIFSPPYLFKGNRPVIAAVDGEVGYNGQFKVTLQSDINVSKVTWVRLSSVTHACNFNQRINRLGFTKNGAILTVTSPSAANLCPPGHYMLFVLSDQGVPSVAKIVRIHG